MKLFKRKPKHIPIPNHILDQVSTVVLVNNRYKGVYAEQIGNNKAKLLCYRVNKQETPTVIYAKNILWFENQLISLDYGY